MCLQCLEKARGMSMLLGSVSHPAGDRKHAEEAEAAAGEAGPPGELGSPRVSIT